MDDAVTTLIDSPLTPYSSAEDIRAWLKQLDKMPDTADVRNEINNASRQLQELDPSN